MCRVVISGPSFKGLTTQTSDPIIVLHSKNDKINDMKTSNLRSKGKQQDQRIYAKIGLYFLCVHMRLVSHRLKYCNAPPLLIVLFPEKSDKTPL